MSRSKIHHSLRKVLALATAADDGASPIPVIVRYRPARDGLATGLEDVTTLQAQRTYDLVPCVAAEIMPHQVEALAQNPAVERIWYDLPVHTMLDVSVPHIGANKVWKQGDKGKGVKVAILDTGCDLKHPDLKARVKAKKDFSGKGSVQDGNGHGSHVAGIIAGSGAASHGKYRGVAPQAELYIAKVLDDRGSGRMSQVMSGLDWAVSKKVQVINLSLGSDINCDGTDALSEACDAAVGKGVVVVVASGNSGPGARTVGAPGCAREVLTIGASTDDDKVASFSSRGPTSDGRVKPDVVLPGKNIISARAFGTTLGTGQIDEHYTALSGTSMATPHATGVVALLLAANPELTPRQIKNILKATAVDLSLNLNIQGAGRVNALAAWKMAKSGEVPQPEPEPTPAPPPPSPEPFPVPPPEDPSGCLAAALTLLMKLLFVEQIKSFFARQR
jgi:serine protease AprX